MRSAILYRKRPFCIFEPPFVSLGATYNDHLRITEKRLVDFLLVLIELFSLGVTTETLYRYIAISLYRLNISGRRGRPPPTILFLRKLG